MVAWVGSRDLVVLGGRQKGEAARPQAMLGASQEGLSYPGSFKGCPGQAVKPQALEQGTCVSRRRPQQAKMVL